MGDNTRGTLGTTLPTRRVFAVGIVALALVAAGCLGGGGGDTTTAATTETAEDTTSVAATTAATTTVEATTSESTGEATTGEATTAGGSTNTTLTVTVQNTSGEPIDNATVSVSEEGGGVLEGIFGGDGTNPGAVGPNGAVTVELADGNYTVEATADGFAPATRQVDVNGTDANVTLSLNESAPITPGLGTQENQTVLPPDTPAGNVTAGTAVQPGNQTPVDVEEEYTVNVTVESGSGEPVENASVQVANEGGPLSSLFGEGQDAGAVNAEGAVSVELSNGTYTVSATADGFADAERDVEVNGTATNVTLALNETTTSGG